MNWTTLFFGNGMVSVGLTAVPIIGMTYVRFVDNLLLICGEFWLIDVVMHIYLLLLMRCCSLMG